MMVLFGQSFALYSERKYDAAIELAARAVDLYPDYWLVHFGMGLALAQKGLLEQAIASLETAVRLSPGFTQAAGFLAALYDHAGRKDLAGKILEKVKEQSTRQ